MNAKEFCTFVFTFCGIKLGFIFIGLPFILIAVSVYLALGIFDIALRFWIERNRGAVSSRKFGNGVFKRASKIALMGAVVIIFGHLNFAFDGSESFGWVLSIGSFIPSALVALFLIEEMVSLVENAIELSRHENKVLFFFKKILGIGLKKGMEITGSKFSKK